LEKTEDFLKFYERVARYIAIRPRSKKEITDYLVRKKVSPALSTQIIAQLGESNLINDAEFAYWWVDQRSTFRPKGKRALLAELSQKGISREIAEKVINQQVNELPLAAAAAQKKLKTLSRFSPEDQRQKLTSFLLRRGFSWETIKSVLQ
jgi:regulatory protein